MDVFLKITNVGKDVIKWPYVVGLLSQAEKIAYNDFKQSADYIGTSDTDKQSRKKVPEAVKAIPFFNDLDKGIMLDDYFYTQNGSRIEKRRYWIIGPDYEEIKKNNSAIYLLRDMCQRYKIKFLSTNTVDELIEKLKPILGDNKKVLTTNQASESGLRTAHERKEIIQTGKKNRDGSDVVMYTGNLIFEEITPDEAKELSNEDLENIENATVISDISRLDYNMLKALAKDKGISDYQRKTKTELIQLLQ